MVAETEAVTSSARRDGIARRIRRRLITRALLRNLPETTAIPRRNLFHFEQEMAEQFAKNRLSSYAVIPVLVVIMGVAIGILGNPLHGGRLGGDGARPARLRDERLAPLPERGTALKRASISGSGASCTATSPMASPGRSSRC